MVKVVPRPLPSTCGSGLNGRLAPAKGGPFPCLGSYGSMANLPSCGVGRVQVKYLAVHISV